MMEWQGIGLLVLLLGLGGMGGLGLSLVFCSRRQTGFDRLALAAMWAPLFTSVAALGLAEAGRFSWGAMLVLSLAWGLLGLGGLVVHRKRAAAEPSGEEPGKSGVFLFWLALLVAGSGLLAVPAHRYLLGGWDPGEYVCTSANIARTGALAIQDPVLAELSPVERTALMHEPAPPRRTLQAGYLVTNEDTGALMPDYYHLYPAWLAVWVSVLGLGGAWAGHTAIALMALAFFAVAGSRLFGRRTALLAALALALCPVQVYLMRFTTAEMLAQFGLFAGFWALERALERPGRGGFAVAAGAAFAGAILAHGTSLLPAAAVGLFLAWHALDRREASAWGAAVAVGLGSLLALGWNAWRADTLTRYLWTFILGNPEHAVMAVAAIAGAWLLGRYGRSRIPGLRWAPGAVMTLALAYAWFVRPGLSDDPDATNVVYLARLVGAAGLVLAALFFWIRPAADWPPARKAFVLAGLLTSAVLLANKMVQPVYLWASRRWAPLVIPFTVLLAAECVVAGLRARPSGSRRGLWTAAVRACALAATVLWGWGLVKAGAPVYGAREYAGLPEAVASVAEAVRDADAVLCDHWEPATPLRYAYGIPAWQLSRLSETGGVREARIGTGLLRRWVAEGKRVFWIGELFYDPAIRLERLGTWSADCRALERRPDRLPRAMVRERHRFVVYRVWPAASGGPVPAPVCVDVGFSAMGLAAGFGKREREWEPNGLATAFRCVRGKGRLCIPEVPGPWRIRLKGELGLEASRVRLSAGGAGIADIEVAPGWAVYGFELPGGLGTNGVVMLELRYDRQRAGRGEGVGVDWLKSGPP